MSEDADLVVFAVRGTKSVAPAALTQALQKSKGKLSDLEDQQGLEPHNPSSWWRDQGYLSELLKTQWEKETGATPTSARVAVEEVPWGDDSAPRANSQSARRKGGKALYDRLKEEEKPGGKPYVVVGFSHGGSVVLEALRLAAKNGGLEKLQKLRAAYTVGTPFIHLTKDWCRKSFKLPIPLRRQRIIPMLDNLGALLFISVFSFLLFLSNEIANRFYTQTILGWFGLSEAANDGFDWQAFVFLLLATVLFILFVVLIGSGLSYYVRYGGRTKQENALRNFPRLFHLSMPGDEAIDGIDFWRRHGSRVSKPVETGAAHVAHKGMMLIAAVQGIRSVHVPTRIQEISQRWDVRIGGAALIGILLLYLVGRVSGVEWVGEIAALTSGGFLEILREYARPTWILALFFGPFAAASVLVRSLESWTRDFDSVVDKLVSIIANGADEDLDGVTHISRGRQQQTILLPEEVQKGILYTQLRPPGDEDRRGAKYGFRPRAVRIPAGGQLALLNEIVENFVGEGTWSSAMRQSNGQEVLKSYFSDHLYDRISLLHTSYFRSHVFLYFLASHIGKSLGPEFQRNQNSNDRFVEALEDDGLFDLAESIAEAGAQNGGDPLIWPHYKD